MDLAAMGQKLHKKYPVLKVKEIRIFDLAEICITYFRFRTDHRVRNGKTVSREKRIRCRADDRTVAEDKL